MSHTNLTEASAVDRLRDIVGASHVYTEAADTSKYLIDWTGEYSGEALAVVRPGSTKEVSELVIYCRENGIVIVPQGGQTGLAGGGIPVGSSPTIVVSLTRMNSIRSLDDAGRTVVAEAGVVLETLQNHVAQKGLLFPLMFGAKGSCTIGGNLATNAGGSNVLRYGNTRELCLGIEAVMADGSIVNGLNGLRKDNTGYDIKDLLIGSEGTLAIITAAVFKLFPTPLTRETAFLSVASVDAAIKTLNILQDRSGNSVEAFEYIPQPVVNAVCKAFPTIRAPLNGNVPTGVLLEISSSRLSDAETDETGSSHLAKELLDSLDTLIEAGLVEDGVIAQSEQQRADFWRLRESVLEALLAYGSTYHFDISLPLEHVSTFLEIMDPKATALGFELLTIGHLGDGNLHYALACSDSDRWKALPLEEAKKEAFTLLRALGGSFSAEHGIGQSKLDVMKNLKDPAQLSLMRSIKHAIDPTGIFNPGKLIPFDE
ncbi:MAG: FAD-binding oxidoreductase [Pseudomonadales bacterium]